MSIELGSTVPTAKPFRMTSSRCFQNHNWTTTNLPRQWFRAFRFFSSVVQAVFLQWPTHVRILAVPSRTVSWWTAALSVHITRHDLILKMAMWLTDPPYTPSHASTFAHIMDRSRSGRRPFPFHGPVRLNINENHSSVARTPMVDDRPICTLYSKTPHKQDCLGSDSRFRE